MIDFALSDGLRTLRDRIHRFVMDEIIPYERDPRVTHHGPSEDLRRELVEKARSAGLLSVQCAAEFGGMGLNHVETAVALEASGWSTLGPVAMNCAAPDEGNMALLTKIASPEQKERWLRPLVGGQFRSCFAMTEPMGAGSDPGQLQTTARLDGNHWVISGRKWLITGANQAGAMIIMAKSGEISGSDGATLFLTDARQPGITIEKVMNTLDSNYVEGHAVVRFDELRLPASDILGEVGHGFRYAQLRLTPARLTHCMRWLGAAARAQSIALDYANRRRSFGRPLGEHQGVSFLLADNEVDLKTARLLIWEACWRLDQGERARHEGSMAKYYVSEALWRVVDRCVQILGGMGISDETVVEWIFRDMRAFRIYDGPSEVHKMAIGKTALRQGTGMIDQDSPIRSIG
jgi:acyl-CoA dehydrogenase